MTTLSLAEIATPDLQELTKTTNQTASPWQVIVLDDPVNLMEYVTRVLMRIFAYTRPKAESMMLEVHQKGRSVVWSGNKEKAEMYVEQLHRAQLKALIERSE